MNDVEPDLWVLVRQSDALGYGGWTVRDETDRTSALRHYVQNVLIEHGATAVQALAGASALSLCRQRSEFLRRLRELRHLNEQDLSSAVGEIERLCGGSTAGPPDASGSDFASRVLARVDQRLGAARQVGGIDILRDALAELADLLRERPAERTRFFDSRSLSTRMPAIDALVDEFGNVGGNVHGDVEADVHCDGVAGDDLWLVPVRRI